MRMEEPDFESLLSEFDLRDMAGFTRNFVEDLKSSLTVELDLEEETDWSGVLCLGMGGSGAGGLFLKSLSDDSGGLPFVVWTDYGVPSWWGPEWLVIATSYSGNTEETLDGVREVISAGGTVVGICSGGSWRKSSLNPKDRCASMCLRAKCPALPLGISSGLNYLPVGHWEFFRNPASSR